MSLVWKIAGLLAVIAAVVFVVVRSDAKVDVTIPVPENVERQPGTHVLLVGCTEYPHLKETLRPDKYESVVPLVGAANDVELLETTFRDYLGVPQENITTLKGWPDDEAKRPTRQNIFDHFERLAQDAQDGDRVIFHFSGHGLRALESADSDELDGYDETLLPADIRTWKSDAGSIPGCIRDDDLWEHVRAVRDRGASVWLSFDCCHAGGATRGEDERVRQLDPELLGVKFEPAAAPAPRSIRRTEDMRDIVSTMACGSHEQAPERVLPKDPDAEGRRAHGLYSYYLATTLQKHLGGLSFAELHRHLVAEFRAYGHTDATPVVEGEATKLRVNPNAPADTRLLLQRVDGTWRLNAGIVRGLPRNSVFEVYRPKLWGQPEGSLGQVRIEDARMHESDCVPNEERPFDAGDAGDILPVIVRSVGVGEVVLSLAVVSQSGAAIDEPALVKQVFQDKTIRSRFPRAATKDEATWLLEADREPYTLRRAKESDDGPRFSIQPEELSDTLYRIFRASYLLRLARGDVLDAPDERLKIEPFWAPSEAEYAKARRPITADMRLTPGCWFGVDLTNLGRSFDVTLAYVDAGYGVTVIFPNSGFGHPDARLEGLEGATIELGPWPLDDSQLGAERFVALVLPSDSSTDPVDFRFLAQPALQPVELTRGGDPTAFVQNLLAGDGNTRGSAPAPESLSFAAFPWQTKWGPVRIPDNVAASPTAPALRTSPTKELHFVGGHMAVLKPKRGLARAVVTWDEKVQQVFIDASTDAPYEESLEELAGRISSGTLKADFVLRVEGKRRTAWYARGGVGQQLSLRMTDENGDAQAEARAQWNADDARWASSATRDPWLRVAYLKAHDDDSYGRVLARLRELVDGP